MGAADRLARQYAQFVREEVDGVLAEASATVARVTGKADADMAADLASLRLQVRAQGRRSC